MQEQEQMNDWLLAASAEPGCHRMLIARYKTFVQGIAARFFPHDRLARAEVENETFFKVFTHAQTAKHTENFKYWIAAIASNTAKSIKRREKRIRVRYDKLQHYISQFQPKSSVPGEKLEMLTRFYACLSKLPDHAHRLIIMVHVLQLPIADIAAELHMSIAHVRVALRRAEQKLTLCIKE